MFFFGGVGVNEKTQQKSTNKDPSFDFDNFNPKMYLLKLKCYIHIYKSTFFYINPFQHIQIIYITQKAGKKHLEGLKLRVI